MRFVKGLELLVVVEGTAILKIYSSGPHKVGQIEPAIAMRTMMIDNKRSVRITASKKKFRGRGSGGGNTPSAQGATTTGKGTEVGHSGGRQAALPVCVCARKATLDVTQATSFLVPYTRCAFS